MNWRQDGLSRQVGGVPKRAECGAQILVTLSHELTERYGRGFDRPNLTRMVKFARLFRDREIGTTEFVQAALA